MNDETVNDEDEAIHLLYLINDIESIHNYCAGLKREHRKAFKQLIDLNEYERHKVIKSYAKLEVKIKDDKFGIENENDDESEYFWEFVWEFRPKFDKDNFFLDNYVAVEKEKNSVAVEKEKLLSKKYVEDDLPMYLGRLRMHWI